MGDRPALAPDSQRNAIVYTSAPASAYCPDALCPESVVTQYTPLLMMCIGYVLRAAQPSDRLDEKTAESCERAVHKCSQTETAPTIFPTPAPFQTD